MRSYGRRFVIGLAAAFCGLAVTAGASQAQEKSKLDEILSRGKLIVGVSSESPPFGFVDEKGELAGFDIDIARLIAKATFGDPGKIEFIRQSAAQRWPNAQNGTIDFGAQTTTIYADRPSASPSRATISTAASSSSSARIRPSRRWRT